MRPAQGPLTLAQTRAPQWTSGHVACGCVEWTHAAGSRPLPAACPNQLPRTLGCASSQVPRSAGEANKEWVRGWTDSGRDMSEGKPPAAASS